MKLHGNKLSYFLILPASILGSISSSYRAKAASQHQRSDLVAGATDEFVVDTDPDAVGMESKSEVALILTEEAMGPQCIAAMPVSPAVAGLVVLHRRCVHRIDVGFLMQSVADSIGIRAPDDAGETLRLQGLAEHGASAKEAALVALRRRKNDTSNLDEVWPDHEYGTAAKDPARSVAECQA